MSTTQAKSANFGSRKSGATGSLGVGYTLLSPIGAVVTPRTTASVVEMLSGSGLYSADVTIPDAFEGSIVWDTGTVFSRVFYAIEDLNPTTVILDSGSIAFPTDKIDSILGTVQSMTGTLQTVTGTLQSMSSALQYIRDMTSGRWKVENNMMKFYAEDNVTLVAQFDLFDENGTPTMGGVFERVKV